MSWVVRQVPVTDIEQLRQAVLRPGQPLSASQYPEDSVALHLAALDDAHVVGCATFFPEPYPGPDVPEDVLGLVCWRLRGMATAEAVRASGVGSAVLHAGLAAVAAAGGELVWCNARTTALPFYERHGFVRVGSEFLFGGEVLLPHYRAFVRVTA